MLHDAKSRQDLDFLPSGNRFCSERASGVSASSQQSTSGGVIRVTGIAFGGFVSAYPQNEHGRRDAGLALSSYCPLDVGQESS